MQKNQNDKSYKRAQPSEKQESRIPAEGVRLNRFLSEAGICSRREADRRIADGRVTIDGRVAEVGQKLMPGQRVACDGVAVSGKDAPVSGPDLPDRASGQGFRRAASHDE